MNRTLARLSRQVSNTNRVVDSAPRLLGLLGFEFAAGFDPNPEEFAIIAAHNRWANNTFSTGAIRAGLVREGNNTYELFKEQDQQKRDYGNSAETLYTSNPPKFEIFDANNTTTPQLTYNDLIIQNIAEGSREKIQLLNSSDTSKIYLFGTDIQMVSISARLINTGIGTTVSDSKTKETYDGQGMHLWKEFYAQARMSECAKNNKIVWLSYANRILKGALTQYTTTFSASQPHLVELSINMMVKSQVVV